MALGNCVAGDAAGVDVSVGDAGSGVATAELVACGGPTSGLETAGSAPILSLEMGDDNGRLVTAGVSSIKGTDVGFLLESPYEGVVVDPTFWGLVATKDANTTSRATL
jgi:hypothetical protein